MKEALKFLNKPLTIRWYLIDSGYTTGGEGYVLTDADATQYPNDINNLSTCGNDLGQCSSKLSLFFEMLSCNVVA